MYHYYCTSFRVVFLTPLGVEDCTFVVEAKQLGNFSHIDSSRFLYVKRSSGKRGRYSIFLKIVVILPHRLNICVPCDVVITGHFLARAEQT